MEETLETITDSATTVLLVVQCVVPPPGAQDRAVAAAAALRPATTALAETAQLCAQHASIAPTARQPLADAARDARDAAAALHAAARAAAAAHSVPEHEAAATSAARAVPRLTDALARALALAAAADVAAASADAAALFLPDSSGPSGPAAAALLRRAARRERACRRESAARTVLADASAALEAALVDFGCSVSTEAEEAARAAVEAAAEGLVGALRRVASVEARALGVPCALPLLPLAPRESAAVRRVRAAAVGAAVCAAEGDPAALADAVRDLADAAASVASSSSAVGAACAAALDDVVARTGDDRRARALLVRDVGAVLEAAVQGADDEEEEDSVLAAATVALARVVTDGSNSDFDYASRAVLVRIVSAALSEAVERVRDPVRRAALEAASGTAKTNVEDLVKALETVVPPHARARALWRVLAREEDALVRSVVARGPAFRTEGAAHARAAAAPLEGLRACATAAHAAGLIDDARMESLEAAATAARDALAALVHATRALFAAPAPDDPDCAALRRAATASQDTALRCAALLAPTPAAWLLLHSGATQTEPHEHIAACAKTLPEAQQDIAGILTRLAEEAATAPPSAGVVECARAISARVAAAVREAGAAGDACATWATALKLAAAQRLCGAPADALAHAAVRLTAALMDLSHASGDTLPPPPPPP